MKAGTSYKLRAFIHQPDYGWIGLMDESTPNNSLLTHPIPAIISQ